MNESNEIIFRTAAVFTHDPRVVSSYVRSKQVITAFSRTPDSLFAGTAPEEWHPLLVGWNDPAYIGKVKILPPVGEHFFTAMQAPFDDLNRLRSATKTFGGRNAECFEFLKLRADRDPEIKPTLRNNVNGGDVLRHPQRIVERHADDGRPDTEALGARRHVRKHDERRRIA